MPQEIEGYLRAQPGLTDEQRAEAWDAFYGASSQEDLTQRLQTLPLPDPVKADLWDQWQPATPQAAPQPAESPSLLSRVTQGVKGLATTPIPGSEVLGQTGPLQAAMTQIPFLEQAKQQTLEAIRPDPTLTTLITGERPEFTHPLAKLGEFAVQGLFPTDPLGIAAWAGGPLGRLGRGAMGALGLGAKAAPAARAAQAAPPIRGLLSAPSAPAARAGETIRLGNVDLGQQVGRAVSSTEPLRPLGRNALPGPVFAGPIGPRVAPPVSRVGRAADEVKRVPDVAQGLPEAERAALMARRAQWTEDLTKAGIEPTPKLMHRMDQVGEKYTKAQARFQQLKAATTGTVDEGELAQAQQYARSLGAQLGGMRSLVKSGKVKSEEALLKALEKALDESGSAATDLLKRLGLPVTGGVIGGAQGETTEERLVGGAIGAGLGLAAPGIARGARRLKPTGISDVVNAALLSNPMTTAKAGLGGLGGTTTGVGEASVARAIDYGVNLVTRGAKELDPRLSISGAKFLKEMARPDLFWKALKKPEVAQRAMGGGITGQKLGKTGLTRQVTRGMTAGDFLVTRAATKAGIPLQEARRLTLAGDPATKSGQQLTRAIGVQPTDTKTVEALKVLGFPFPKVGVNMAEQALRRVPGLNFLPGIRQGAPAALQIARGASGASAFEAGRRLEGDIPVAAQPAAIAAAGPNALLYGAGLATSLAQRKGQDALSTIGSALRATGQELPVIGETTFSPVRKFVPSGLAAVARGMDPAFGRETGAEALEQAGQDPSKSLVAPLIAGIPGQGIGPIPGRETLPERGTPRDVFGQKRVEQSQIGKALSPAREAFLPPAFDVTDPGLAGLVEMGVEFDAPSGDVSIGGFKLPISVSTKGLIQEARGEARRRAVEVVSNHPNVRAMPNTPAKTKLVKDAINSMTQQFLGMQALAIVKQQEPDAFQRLRQQVTQEQ